MNLCVTLRVKVSSCEIRKAMNVQPLPLVKRETWMLNVFDRHPTFVKCKIGICHV